MGERFRLHRTVGHRYRVAAYTRQSGRCTACVREAQACADGLMRACVPRSAGGDGRKRACAKRKRRAYPGPRKRAFRASARSRGMARNVVVMTHGYVLPAQRPGNTFPRKRSRATPRSTFFHYPYCKPVRALLHIKGRDETFPAGHMPPSPSKETTNADDYLFRYRHRHRCPA